MRPLIAAALVELERVCFLFGPLQRKSDSMEKSSSKAEDLRLLLDEVEAAEMEAEIAEMEGEADEWREGVDGGSVIVSLSRCCSFPFPFALFLLDEAGRFEAAP